MKAVNITLANILVGAGYPRKAANEVAAVTIEKAGIDFVQSPEILKFQSEMTLEPKIKVGVIVGRKVAKNGRTLVFYHDLAAIAQEEKSFRSCYEDSMEN